MQGWIRLLRNIQEVIYVKIEQFGEQIVYVILDLLNKYKQDSEGLG